MSIWRWAELLPPIPESTQISLGEGNTPLVRSRQIGPEVGLEKLYFKLEHGNATGSYKDRFGFMAVSHMLAEGKKRCLATSSGNTGAALAAYCAAAEIDCRIAIVEGAPLDKLQQMMAYGAHIARFKGFGTDPVATQRVFDLLKKQGDRSDTALQISAFTYSPVGMSGVQTMAYELAEQVPAGIDHVFCPAGGGGACVALARGFQQLKLHQQLVNLPAVECVQPEGNNTIAGPLREGRDAAQEINCTTKVSGLQVASVVDGHLAVQECRATGGTGHLVTDQEVWDTQSRLARKEGIFTEPAGAVALAGALKAFNQREIASDAMVVCIVSGSGFKDAKAVNRMNASVQCPLLEADAIQEW